MIFSQVDAPFPYYEVKTKKEFDRGTTINNIYVPKFVKLDLILGLYKGMGTVCYSCHSLIKKGDLVGKEIWSSNHCKNCIEIPTEPIEVWHMTYTMKRRSRKHPNGKVEMSLISTPQKLQEYFEAVISTRKEVLITKNTLASYLE